MLPELSAEFFGALVGIVLADLVLAGDNAVVIALAARNLPVEQRRKAVIFGAAMAIAFRAILTVGAVFLLRGELPGVMLVGGIALLWIGWQLAREEEDDHEGIDSAKTMRGAIRTILIADVVMSVDNVLAVAAFAKDDAWLVVFGLLISIPIVMGGATILLRIIDRFPIIVWIGAALILYVAVELILNDPLVHDYLPSWLEPQWTHRVAGVVFGMLLASIAWYLRTHDDDGADARTPATDALREDADGPSVVDAADAAAHADEEHDSNTRLMIEGSKSDD